MLRVESGKLTLLDYFDAEVTGLTAFTVSFAKNTTSFTTMTTPTVTEVGTTGIYALLLDEGTTIAAGNQTESVLYLIQHVGMPPKIIKIEIYDAPDVNVKEVNDVVIIGDGSATPFNVA